jgi:hypothetical protein
MATNHWFSKFHIVVDGCGEGLNHSVERSCDWFYCCCLSPQTVAAEGKERKKCAYTHRKKCVRKTIPLTPTPRDSVHRVDRVLGFFSSRPNWDPHPLTRR